MSEFVWWRPNGDGSASPLPDTPEVRDAIDAGHLRVFGSIEGAIINGGVLATAFRRRTDPTYDAARWLRDGALVETGSVTTTTITATPKERPS